MANTIINQNAGPAPANFTPDPARKLREEEMFVSLVLRYGTRGTLHTLRSNWKPNMTDPTEPLKVRVRMLEPEEDVYSKYGIEFDIVITSWNSLLTPPFIATRRMLGFPFFLDVKVNLTETHLELEPGPGSSTMVELDGDLVKYHLELHKFAKVHYSQVLPETPEAPSGVRHNALQSWKRQVVLRHGTKVAYSRDRALQESRKIHKEEERQPRSWYTGQDIFLAILCFMAFCIYLMVFLAYPVFNHDSGDPQRSIS